MTLYFLDTTVLTELALKQSPLRKPIQELLRGADSELPTFAIREFKAGPLYYWAWLHNKLVTTASFGNTLAAIQVMARTPRRNLPATALEALNDVYSRTIGKDSLGDLASKYGSKRTADETHADVLRLHIFRRIRKAWQMRRTVCSRVVIPLDCYHETGPVTNRKLIDLNPLACSPATECCLATELRAKKTDLKALCDANDKLSGLEAQRRGKVIKKLLTTKSGPLTAKECRSLGDALFAFYSPSNAIVLTTNIRDHTPLATALGKSTLHPTDNK